MVARGGRAVSATEGHDGDNSLMGWAVVTGTSTPLTTVDEAAHHEFLEALHVITTAPETAAAALLRLGQENAALAAALNDIAGMRELPDGTWVADAECMNMRGRCWEHLGKPDGGPDEWCHTCVAEVAWCAWKLGVLR